MHDEEYNQTMKNYLMDRLDDMMIELIKILKEIELWHPIKEDSDGDQ